MKINKFIDHTILKASATLADIKKLCEEAKKYDFFSVCVNPCYLLEAKDNLKGTDIKVCCVAAFPLGSNSLQSKIDEVKWLIDNKCDEVDFVLNVGNVKNKKWDLVKKEFDEIRKITKGHVVKVILETCYLENNEIVEICKIADKAGIDFVKTSTGFGSGGATIEHVELMKKSISDKTSVKASGGVRTYEDAIAMINAGASRLGTSNGIAIVTNTKAENNY